jgi:hypothetical protein
MLPLEEVVGGSDRFSYNLLIFDLFPNPNHSIRPKKTLNIFGEKYELF